MFVSSFAFWDYARLKSREKSWLLLIITISMFLFAGFRGAIDNDYNMYSEIYRYISESSFKDALWPESFEISFTVEIGFRFLNKVIAMLFDNAQIIFLCMAVLSVTINNKVIYKLSPLPFVSILLYFVHNFLLRDMMQIRSGLACAFCMLALYDFIKHKSLRFYLYVLIGALFHTVALIFMVFPIVMRMKLTKKQFTVLLLSCFVIAAVSPLGSLIRIFPMGDAFAKVQGYANNSHSEAIGLTNPVLIKQLLISGICLYFYDLLNARRAAFKALYVSYFIGTCWLLLFVDFGIIAGRVATVFSSVEVILIAIILEAFFLKVPFLKFMSFLFLLVFAALLFYVNIYTRDYFQPYLLNIIPI